MFEIENLKYKDIIEIERVLFEKEKINIIKGPSGCGKSTFLKLLNKIISPDQGVIIYEKENLDKLDTINHRQKILLLSQTPTIFSGTIRDNLNIGLKFQNKYLAKDYELTNLLGQLKLDKALDDNASKLSGGEKQRIALGRLVLLNPEVFLLDEPSSGLDKETEKFIVDFVVKYVSTNKKSLIMITHSTEILNKYSENIIDFTAINKAYKKGEKVFD